VTIQISKADESHIKSILDIATETGISVWSRSDYEQELSRSDSLFLVAGGADTKCLGFVLGRLIPGAADESTAAEILNIAVRPTLYRSKIGSRLIAEFLTLVRESGANEVHLEVRSGNHGAIEFYKNHGFTTYGSRPLYYTNPSDDATLMRSRL
jgi:ribosomal-protein-alanine N-acetyltransferase